MSCTPSSQEQDASRQAVLTSEFAPDFTQVTADYRQDMADIQAKGRDALAAGDQHAVLEVYRALAEAGEAAADGMAAIEPPAALADQHALLVENLRHQHEALNTVVAAAAAQRDADLTDGLSDLAALLAEFSTLHAAIDQELAQGP